MLIHHLKAWYSRQRLRRLAIRLCLMPTRLSMVTNSGLRTAQSKVQRSWLTSRQVLRARIRIISFRLATEYFLLHERGLMEAKFTLVMELCQALRLFLV